MYSKTYICTHTHTFPFMKEIFFFALNQKCGYNFRSLKIYLTFDYIYLKSF